MNPPKWTTAPVGSKWIVFRYSLPDRVYIVHNVCDTEEEAAATADRFRQSHP